MLKINKILNIMILTSLVLSCAEERRSETKDHPFQKKQQAKQILVHKNVVAIEKKSEEDYGINDFIFSWLSIFYDHIRPNKISFKYKKLMRGIKSCPEDMVYIPEGWFAFFGYAKGPRDSDRPYSVEEEIRYEYLDHFCIDKYEATVSDYRECMAAGGCPSPYSRDYTSHFKSDNISFYDHPANGITLKGADAYCRWKEKRLPSYREWSKAAGGLHANYYPLMRSSALLKDMTHDQMQSVFWELDQAEICFLATVGQEGDRSSCLGQLKMKKFDREFVATIMDLLDLMDFILIKKSKLNKYKIEGRLYSDYDHLLYKEMTSWKFIRNLLRRITDIGLEPSDSGSLPVGFSHMDVSFYDVHGMTGGVSEWVLRRYKDDVLVYQIGCGYEGQALSWCSTISSVRQYDDYFVKIGHASPDQGVRCAKSLE